LHGGAGENGEIQSVFSLSGIPYTSSDNASCAICMDKIFAKDVLSANGIDNVPYTFVLKDEYLYDKKKVFQKIKQFGLPVIIKPSNLGSSIGINVAKKISDLDEVLSFAFEFDERVLIEKYLNDCEEYNCACMMSDDELLCSKVFAVDKSEIFTFDEKYLRNTSKKPKKIEKSIEKQIKTLAKKVYMLLNCKGVVRIDFLIKNENVYVNEVNSIPGSLSIHMFNGISKSEFVEDLIFQAKKNDEQKKCLTSVFRSEALNIFKDAISNAKMNK
jgi:D-alanine-D-alanine ligase